jgi:Ni/Co efflux regulator RcnB
MSIEKNKLKAIGFALAVTVCVAGGFSVPAHADDYNSHAYNRHNDSDRRDHDRDKISFDDNDRRAINTYMKRHHHGHCPPGLAKKHNGCLPPGHARRYEIGQRLSSRVNYVIVPYSLRRNMRPLQPGYQYVRVDDDVLLMSKNDRTIIDAVRLISDLAN